MLSSVNILDPLAVSSFRPGIQPRARVARVLLPALVLVVATTVAAGDSQVVGEESRIGGSARAASAPQQGWPQWGGPGRDFKVDVTGLADSWPEAGPPTLWRRPLGEGHSTIAFHEGHLYTMYRPRPEDIPRGEWSDEEAVVSLDAGSGETLWEYRYASEPLDFQFGAGPHSTPLVVDGRVFTGGSNKQIHAFDAASGELLWNHDLVQEYGAPPRLIRPSVKAGYACSPLAYRGTVIVTAGGEGQSVMAFDQEDGSLVWSSGDFLIAPASPILIDVDGREQLVVLGGRQVVGMDPGTGEILWSHPHDTRGDMNNTTPVWSPDRNLLYVSSAYDGGSRVMRLEADPGRARGTEAEEVWYSREMQVMFGSTVRVGDTIYGSSGGFGPTFLTAVDLPTGELLWRERGFGRASLVHTGSEDRVIVLDEDGNLALTRMSPAGMEVLTRAQVLATTSWSAPTVVGTTLYVRDRAVIQALDLGS